MAVLEIMLGPAGADQESLSAFLADGLPSWDYSAVILRQGLAQEDLNTLIGLYRREQLAQMRSAPVMPDCAFTAKVGDPVSEKVSEWFAIGHRFHPQVGLTMQLKKGSVQPHREDKSEKPFGMSTAINQPAQWQTQLATPQHLDSHPPKHKNSYGIPFDSSIAIDTFTQNPGDTVIIPGYGFDDHELPSIHAVSASPGRIALINHFVIVDSEQ